MSVDPVPVPPARSGKLAGWFGLALVALVLVGLLAVVSWRLDPQGFVPKLAESLLQLGIIVILGAAAKYIVDDDAKRRDDSREEREKQLAQAQKDDEKRHEFLRRVSSAHVRIAHARLLMKAHRSARTYTKQLRHLMRVRPEVDEIVEDLRATDDLFGDDTSRIADNIEWIGSYLRKGADEYLRFHELVSDRARQGQSFDSTVSEAVRGGRRMEWVDGFTGGDDLPEDYNDALKGSKHVMRARVFGPD